MKNLFLNLVILVNVLVIIGVLIFLAFVGLMLFWISEAVSGFADSIVSLAV